MHGHLKLEHGSIASLRKLVFGYHTLTALDNGAGGLYLSPADFGNVTQKWTSAIAERNDISEYYIYTYDTTLKTNTYIIFMSEAFWSR